MCLSGTKDLVRVGRKMIKIQVTLRLRKPTKTFRKAVKMFAKFDVWVWEWLQTWLVLTERQCDKPCGRSGRISGRTSGRCIRTMPQLTTPFRSRSFFPINANPILEHPSYSRFWHPVTFFCTPKWKVYWSEPIFHQLKRWRQKRHSYWTAWGLMSCSTALNNGGHEWSGGRGVY